MNACALLVTVLLFLISLHPSLPLLASCSGERKLRNVSSSSDEEEGEELLFTRGNEVRENMLKIWSLPQSL